MEKIILAIAVLLLCCPGLAGLHVMDCADAMEAKKKIDDVEAKGGVVLESAAGKCVAIKVLEAEQSETIKNLIEDSGSDSKIPLPAIGNTVLEDISTLLVAMYEKATMHEKLVAIKSNLPSHALRILDILQAANFLDIPTLMSVAIKAYGQQVFSTNELRSLSSMNQEAYKFYVSQNLSPPKDIQKLVISRYLRSIDRVFVNNTPQRRADAIKILNLPAAQVVAYIAENNTARLKDLPNYLQKALVDVGVNHKIHWGPMPTEFAVWPRHCPVNGYPNYSMYSDATPDERYEDNADGTITDVCTKLIWEQTPHNELLYWAPAKKHCAELRKADFSDWRMPTRIELQTLVGYGQRSALNQIFKGKGWFWSSSLFSSDAKKAWSVKSENGEFSAAGVGVFFHGVRCVR